MKKRVKIILTISALLLATFICSTITAAASAATETSLASAAKALAGKTVWVVDVNTNADYSNALLLRVVQLLPEYLPGVKVVHVTTAEKGNPFFLLKPENYPDAVIIGVGVCESTTPQVVNYAARAKEKKIPCVICYDKKLQQVKDKYVVSYRVPDVPAYELTDSLPSTQQENDAEARRLTPMFVEGLLGQLQ